MSDFPWTGEMTRSLVQTLIEDGRSTVVGAHRELLDSVSPYRRVQVLRALAAGWEHVRLVDRVTRGSAVASLSRPVAGYTLEIRPSASGRWGKPLLYRMVP